MEEQYADMKGAVGQDSVAMRAVAEKIRKVAKDFLTKKDEFFKDVQDQIGETEDKTTWYGPNAGKFITDFNNTETEFKKAYDNLNSLADNLDSHAAAWEKFERQSED